MYQRYFIELSYKGTNFFGWQIQPRQISVQEELTKCFSTILNEEIKITGAGRTDTGVHAKFYVAHFDSKNLDLNADILFRVNGFLHKDIAVSKIYKVKPEVSSRFDAISRTYEYHISRVKNPFLQEYSHFLYGKLDVEKMNQACQVLFEYEDFTSFSKLHTDSKTNLCKIYKAEWTENDNLLIFTISANRFLRNMVRSITGTIIEVGQGKISIDDFRKIIEAKNRCEAGLSMPAKGLFLSGIEYSGEVLLGL